MKKEEPRHVQLVDCDVRDKRISYRYRCYHVSSILFCTALPVPVHRCCGRFQKHCSRCSRVLGLFVCPFRHRFAVVLLLVAIRTPHSRLYTRAHAVCSWCGWWAFPDTLNAVRAPVPPFGVHVLTYIQIANHSFLVMQSHDAASRGTREHPRSSLPESSYSVPPFSSCSIVDLIDL